MPRTSLFDEHEPIEPAADRTEPDIWVRRLVLVGALPPDGETVREVQFRRGINIIRAAERPPEETRPVGHSVGKTLLLRLIRYCLGEAAFCTRAVRSAIAAQLPEAFVLAEIRLLGEPWVVARPIGNDPSTTASRAAPGQGIGALRDAKTKGFEYARFREAIAEATAGCFADMKLPVQGRKPQWLDLLGWLARDQECRFRDHLEWRDPDSGSGTVQLKKEDAALVMRMVMGLLGDQERKLRVKHAVLLKEKAELDGEIQRLSNLLEAIEADLREALEIPDDAPHGEMFGPIALRKAEEQQATLKRLLDDTLAKSRVDELDQKRTEAAVALGVAKREAQRAEGVHEETEAELQQAESASDADFHASLATQGGWCHLFLTKEEAIRHGCPGSPVDRKPGERDPLRERRVAECRQLLEDAREQLVARRRELERTQKRSEQALEAYRQEMRRVEKAVEGIRWEIAHYRDLARRAKRYGEQWAKHRRLEGQLDRKEKAIQDSLNAQERAREQLRRNLGVLSRHFDATLYALLGKGAGGQIELDGRGIHPHPNDAVAASGEALGTSAMVLGFDVACLIASVCGLGHFPRLLLHDSPREADMEVQMYHRLFAWMLELERAFGSAEPSFQYIVTTTTPPPRALAGDPFVRLTLDARNEEGLLLKHSIHVGAT